MRTGPKILILFPRFSGPGKDETDTENQQEGIDKNNYKHDNHKPKKVRQRLPWIHFYL